MSSAAAAAPAVAGSGLSVDEKLSLITRNLDEVMGGDVALGRMRAILQERDLRIYWGTATTGAPHIAYFVPMSKIADFLRAGCHVTILFADLHAFLDNLKTTWDRLQHRTEYYERVIQAMLRSIGVNIDRLTFVRGTSYQLSREYSLDMYKLTTLTTERNAKKAGAEVVKQVDSPLLSGMLYPLLQALDEEYLHVDAQFGGVDQRKIFTFAERALPALGYGKRLHLMNPMVPGLQGAKMSSSEASSKIDLLDPPASIASKVKGAFCEEGNIEGNGVLAFVRMVLFALPAFAQGFTVKRKSEHGGDRTFTQYVELERAFIAKEIHPVDLKQNVTAALNDLLEPIRREFQSEELRALVQRAYQPSTEHETRQAAAIEPDDDEPPAASANAAHSIAPNGASVDGATAVVSKLDIRVGSVVSVEAVPGSTKLFVESIDVGESEPRQVVSGLAPFMSIDALQGAKVCVLVNLKPAKLAGVKSLGMVLCASSEDGTTAELLQPPAGAAVGERVFFPPVHDAAAKVEARANEKTLEQVWPQFRTNALRQATFNGLVAHTSAGPVTVPSLTGASIK